MPSFFSYLLPIYTLFLVLSNGNALPQPSAATHQQEVINPRNRENVFDSSPRDNLHDSGHWDSQKPLSDNPSPTRSTLGNLLEALDVMQSSYFEIWQGTWPTSIDWTAAVLGTQVSATLSILSWTFDDIFNTPLSSTSTAAGGSRDDHSSPINELYVDEVSENLINRYFAQTSAFYFGEDAFAVRNQAFDDMLWVVLGWLENIKLQNLHSWLHYSSRPYSENDYKERQWHGTQLSPAVAHRANVFYQLASQGWDTVLCDGGMIWSPYLTPYKNAITNELFISASIGMYLYFPGDNIDSPFLEDANRRPHNPVYLEAAIRGYRWLKESGMTTEAGLYGDGFHIKGWRNPMDPGTRKCDVFNRMVFTYNQGVVLSGLRGLWLATGISSYLEDGHELVENVIKATGWPDKENQDWKGLGRGGVLEEFCDSAGECSQNGHTFKGIFFHHLTEFCRPLSPEEEQFLEHFLTFPPSDSQVNLREELQLHQAKCARYGPWIQHNANAALMTKNKEGKFGTWWGRQYPDPGVEKSIMVPTIPQGAIDYSNNETFTDGSGHPYGIMKGSPLWGLGTTSNNYEGSLPGGWKAEGSSKATRAGGNSQKAKQETYRDVNDRGRGRTVETQSGGVAVLRALYLWENMPTLVSADSDEELTDSDD